MSRKAPRSAKTDKTYSNWTEMPRRGKEGHWENDKLLRKLASAAKRLDAELRRPPPWMRSLLASSELLASKRRERDSLPKPSGPTSTDSS